MPAAENDQEWLDFLRKGLKDANINDESSSKMAQNGTKDTASPEKKPPFEPKDRTQIKPSISLPDELWLAILETPCTFPTEIFNTVMLNLIKNPNITSSHLFRADIFYDSDNDHLFKPEDAANPYQGLAKHLQAEYQPIQAPWPGFHLERTIVRRLIPRNPQLDKSLVQTCHFFTSQTAGDNEEEQNLVLYIPHVTNPDEMPFYHPTVSQLAFLHSSTGTLTLLYHPFPSSPNISTKLERTALKLLQTIHKHGQGQLLGYEKRVHLDQIIPQKRYQDTYTRLKVKYGRHISEQWVEVTDAGKHVFEDLGIAAYLIELWRDLYPGSPSEEGSFPGFVDIGCGNGLLVYLLGSEGYDGWGFDARERKTWAIFPEEIQAKLQQRILVPEIFQDHEVAHQPSDLWHRGIFTPGTFIVSNHADELTPWTPLIAYMNQSSFIAIPCCSHDLAGARFRAPASTRAEKDKEGRLPQQEGSTNEDGLRNKQVAETGSLKRTEAQKKMPSAYSTLCSYVTSLATEMDFQTEGDVLRIPSTRNSCIVGREWNASADSIEERSQRVTELVEREVKRSISSIGAEWIERAEKLMKKPLSGH